MTVIRRNLSESIVHIEDLPIDEFIDVLRNLGTMTGQEKLDGANCWVGLDEEGKLFTSREGKRKGAERRYSEADWPKVSAFNQFRAAHVALEQVNQEIQTVLSSGDTVEAEVLFGRQPNAVSYGLGGKSFIAFLRGVNETADTKAEQLGTSLANRQVEASVTLVDTSDGKELTETHSTLAFQFVSPQKIDSSALQTSVVEKDLKKLEKFLTKASDVEGMTNQELLVSQLGSVSKEQREGVKTARAALLATIQADYKLPIKAALLDKVVRNVRSGLSADNLSDDEDIGIEGVVLRDPNTGKQVKIVDKDIFTAINKFNQAVRGQIASNLMTTNPDSSLESRGGLVGSMRIRIAELLGNRELARNANVRKILEPIKGGSPEEAIKNLAGSMTGVDDYQQIKKKILAIIQQTYKDLDAKLEEFKEQKDEYRLKLKNGKSMGLSDDTVKKTLLSFAEARRNINDQFDKIKKTKSLAQLLAIMYGGAAKAVHQTELVEEAAMPRRFPPIKVLKPAKSKKVIKPKIKKIPSYGGDNGLQQLGGKDTFELVNSYLSTVFMSMVIYHEHEPRGMIKLRDRKHSTLKGWSIEMSPLNFWGYAIWRAGSVQVKQHLQKKTASEISRAVSHIQAPWWKFLHMDFSFDKQGREVHWNDHRRTIARLIELTGLRSDRLNTLLDSAVRWPELTFDEKIKAINKLYFHAQQFVPRSSLFQRIRVIQSNMVLNPTGDNPLMMTEGSLLKSITNIREADSSSGGSAPGGESSAPSAQGGDPFQGTTVSGATTSANIGTKEKKLTLVKRPLIKRKRNPNVKDLMLKFKDPRKSNELKSD